MRQALSFFRIRFSTGLQYRTVAFAGMCTQFVWGGMLIAMYAAFYRTNPQAFPMEFPQLSSYIWLQQAFLALLNTWSIDGEIFSSITSGQVSYELVRPIHLYAMWYSKEAAKRTSAALLRCGPVLVVSCLLPDPYGLSFPPNAGALLEFVFSLILGLGMVVSLTMLLYALTFFTMYPSGLRMIAVSLSDFLAGGIVPLPFLPDSLRTVLELTPFSAIANLPFRLYSGHIAGKEAVFFLLLQMGWLAVTVAVGILLMRKALTRAVIQGG